MKFKLFGLAAICGLLSVGVFAPSVASQAKAEEHQELPYDSLWINDLSQFAGNGATIDSTTYNVSNLVSSGSFIYGSDYKNVEYKVNVNAKVYEGNPWFALSARAQSSNIMGGVWEHTGYYVRLYANGMFEFLKDGASILAPDWGSYGIAAETDMLYVFKVVDCADGAVHITCSCNGLEFLNYYDVENVLVSGGFAGFQEAFFNGISFSGSGSNLPILNMNDVVDPYTNANFPATINSDKSVTTNETGGAGYSGAVYGFHNVGKGYGYKVKVTPHSYSVAAASAEIVFQLGGVKGVMDYARPNVVDATWGWVETGYVFHYCASGQRHLYRGATLLSYGWDQAGLIMDTTYEFEFAVMQMLCGDRITLKANGNYIFNYFDAKTDSYTPVQFPVGGGNLNNAIGVYTVCMNGEFAFDTKAAFSTKTVLSKDLGTPVSNNESKFLADGEVSHFNDGVAVGYNADLKNASVVMNANFKTFAAGNPGIAFMLNYSGSSLDGAFGGDWTSKGYAIILYINGMVGIYKSGVCLFEGWWTGGVALSLNTDFKIEVGSAALVGGGSKFFVKINDNSLLNFVDTEDPITNSGWFAVDAMGITGSLLESGFDRPVMTVSSDEVEVDSKITLGYENPDDKDTVTYYVDEENSEGSGSINGNEFTGLEAGSVSVYAVVNGVASEAKVITVKEGVKAILEASDDKLVVGGDTVTLSAKLSDESEVVSVVYNVTPVTGNALVDQNTGILTGTKAGTVKVSATVNETFVSEDKIFYVSPIVFVKNVGAIAKGGTRVMEYQANSELPDEEIDYSFEIVDGGEHASVDNSTHTLSAISVGEFAIKVTVTGETFTATSEATAMAVDNPVVVITTVVKDMIVGQSQKIDAEISGGEVLVTSKSLVIETGADCVSVTDMTLNAIKAGTVKFHAILNGESGLTKTIVVSPFEGIINAADMYVNDTQKLSMSFNDKEFVPTSIIYSIVSGGSLASIEGDVLTTKNVPGIIKIKAVVDSSLSFEKEIVINNTTSLFGLAEGDKLEIGRTYDVVAMYKGLDEVTSVEFIVDNPSICEVKTSLEEGKPLIETVCTLTPKAIGNFSIRAVVNQVSSISINASVVYAENRCPVSITLTGGKLEFSLNEAFSVGDLVVSVNYNDGTSVVVNNYQVEKPDMKTEGTKEVKISFTDKQTTVSASYQVNVIKNAEKENQNNAVIIAVSCSVGGAALVSGAFVVGIKKFGWFKKSK